MFEGGKLISTYISQAKDGETVALEPRGQSPEGRYVVLQKNNQGLTEDEQQLHVTDVVAFGKYSGQIFSECEGLQQPKVIESSSPHGSYPIKEIFTDGDKYWLAANNYTGPGFTLRLSTCELGIAIAGVLVKNVKHQTTTKRATKDFKILGANKEAGSWKKLIDGNFEDPFSGNGPAPTIKTFYFTETTTMKFIRFDIDSFWGISGGLDYFGVITGEGIKL